jgi:hypothetical protein
MVRWCGLAGLFVLIFGACDADSSADGDDAAGGRAGSATGGSGAGGSSQCGGGNGAFTPAAVEAHADYCAARAAHVAACGTPNDEPTCPEVSCLERLYESAGFVSFAECQTRKACEAFLASDDDCFESASGTITQEMLDFVSYCQGRLEECAPSFSDDLCSVVSPVIQRGIFCAVDACLRGPCDAVSACLEQDAATIPDCW